MKDKVSPDVFHNETNFAVIKMAERKYPGVLIQGDSLAGIVGDLDEAANLFETDRAESFECLKGARDELKWRLEKYLEVCGENGIE